MVMCYNRTTDTPQRCHLCSLEKDIGVYRPHITVLYYYAPFHLGRHQRNTADFRFRVCLQIYLFDCFRDGGEVNRLVHLTPMGWFPSRYAVESAFQWHDVDL